MRFSFLSLSILVLASTAPAADAPQGPANRLAKESSPYLRQHAHNPVDWYPWGAEAFAKAKKENKLVFLSIGYSSCHWCHVMERESFSNAQVAKILNEKFVCIKVDREERPEIDEIYMDALHVLGQNGGWPLSMFLMPDGKPIIGGTYWPPEDREIEGQTARGFKSILSLVQKIYAEQPKKVEEQAGEIARLTNERLGQRLRGRALVELNRTLLDDAILALREEHDSEHGGFGRAQRAFRGPKFPMPSYLLLLESEMRRSKSPELKKILDLTLDRMARGGIYDHLGGGFHRYSTERTWTVPHFEKMLYDNAQLAEVYSRAHEQSPDPLYEATLRGTLDFVLREMTAPQGGFYSALDADSEGEEGRFYVWTPKDLEAALPDAKELTLLRTVYGIDRGLNFEQKYSILTLPERVEAAAKAKKIDAAQLATLPTIRKKLFEARAKRPRPFLDQKILTAWNGQMIAGFAVAGRVLKEPRYVDAARKAADFILTTMKTKEGRLLRTCLVEDKGVGSARLNAYLDDHAFLAHGLLALHDATGAARWLDEVKKIFALTERWYRDTEAGGYFFTSHDHEKLFARSKDQYDGAQPCGNSMATLCLVRLWRKTKDVKYRDLARSSLETFAASMKSNPTSVSLMMLALAEYLDAAEPAPGPKVNAPGGGGSTKSDSVVKITSSAEKPDAAAKQTVTLTFTIDKPWHLYGNPIDNEMLASAQTEITLPAGSKAKLVKIEYPKGKKVADKLVGDYMIYEGKVEIRVTLDRSADPMGKLELQAKFMACEESKDGKAGRCLLPAKVMISVGD